MKTITAAIVFAWDDPGKTAARSLKTGGALYLVPEPHPKDLGAIKVMADIATPELVRLQVGWVAKTGGTIAIPGGGNREVAAFFAGVAPPWPARLGHVPISRASTAPAAICERDDT